MDEQYALDWDCEPNWDDDYDDLDHIPPDLSGQGIPTHRLLTMTSIEPRGGYL